MRAGIEMDDRPPLFRTMRPDEVDAVFDLIQAAFGDRWPNIPIGVAPREHLAWKMSSPKLLPEEVSVIEFDGRLTGYWGVIGRDVWLRGERARGRFGVDRLVLPEFQGRRWSTLHREWLHSQRPTVLEATNIGMHSNHPILRASSGRVAAGRLTFANPIDLLLRPLDRVAIVRGALARRSWRSFASVAAIFAKDGANRLRHRGGVDRDATIELRDVARFDERADQLWEQVASTLDFAVIRDREYLNWRWCDPRAGVYRIRAAERQGELRGFMVTTAGGGEIRVADWLVHADDPAALVALLDDAIAFGRRAGSTLMSMQMPRRHRYREAFHLAGFHRAGTLGRYGQTPGQSRLVAFLGTDAEARVHVSFGDEDTV